MPGQDPAAPAERLVGAFIEVDDAEPGAEQMDVVAVDALVVIGGGRVGTAAPHQLQTPLEPFRSEEVSADVPGDAAHIRLST